MPSASKFSPFPTRYGIVMHIPHAEARYRSRDRTDNSGHLPSISKDREVYRHDFAYGRVEALSRGDDPAPGNHLFEMHCS